MRLLIIALTIAVAACGSPQPNGAADRNIVLTAIPLEFVGQWAASKESCFDEDGVGVLQIRQDGIDLQEAQSVGPLSIERVGRFQIEVETVLTGEGEQRTEKLGFILQDDGDALVESGYGPHGQNRYVKCPGSAQAGMK